jgi:hypothetical protein
MKRLQRLDAQRRAQGIIALPRDIERDGPATNPSETEFRYRAEGAGWQVTKRGWPDFIIRRGGRIAFVEVKPDSPIVSAPQWSILEYLASKGLECYVWTPKSGFHRMGRDQAIRATRGKKA